MNPGRRRLGFVLAAVVACLAVFVAAFPLIQPGGSGTLEGPAIVPRPIIIGLLLALPAGIAAIAAYGASRPMFIAAGVLSLLESFVSFGGITFGFLLPGTLLIALGLERPTTPSPSRLSRRARFAGLLVVALGIAAWVVPFAMSETVCWMARTGPDGSMVYTRIPNTDTITLGVSDVGGGCDGGAFTLEGLMLAGVVAIGALAMAGLGAGAGRRPSVP
jgi:hypothetical protein